MQPWKIRVRTYLTGTWHYRWIGMGVAWAVCILGWLGVALVPNQFQAVSMIYVDTDTMMAPLLKDLTVSTDPQQQVSVMLNTLLARPNLEQVVHLTNPKANSLSSAEMAKQVEALLLRSANRQHMYHSLVSINSCRPTPGTEAPWPR